MAFGILSTVYGTSAKQEKQMSIEFVIHAALNTIEWDYIHFDKLPGQLFFTEGIS